MTDFMQGEEFYVVVDEHTKKGSRFTIEKVRIVRVLEPGLHLMLPAGVVVEVDPKHGLTGLFKSLADAEKERRESERGKDD